MNHTRRRFLKAAIATTAATPPLHAREEPGFGPWKPLFDGETLGGWKAIPRLGTNKVLRGAGGHTLTSETIGEAVKTWFRNNEVPRAVLKHTGDWKVSGGAIVGGQSPAGCRHGAYLISDGTFGDFELEYDIHPDWCTDTGVLIRQHPIGALGIQVLCDHRPNGGIGGIFTNGLGGYRAAPFVVQGDKGEGYSVADLREGTPDTRFRSGQVTDGASFEQFRDVWKLNGFNRFRVRSIGSTPVVTTWINGLKIATVDTGNPGVEGYDPSQIERLVGRRGHIGLEVHSNSKGRGWEQWEKGAVCRWKNLRIREAV